VNQVNSSLTKKFRNRQQLIKKIVNLSSEFHLFALPTIFKSISEGM